MSAIEFSHVFFGRPLFNFLVNLDLSYLFYESAIIRPHQMTEPLKLLFMYFLQYWFNFQFLSHHIVSYSVSSPFILSKYFISAAWILLLMFFVGIQLLQYVRIGEKIALYAFTLVLLVSALILRKFLLSL